MDLKEMQEARTKALHGAKAICDRCEREDREFTDVERADVAENLKTAADLKAQMEQGFRFFQAKSDLGFMTAGAKAFLEPLGKSAALTGKTSPLY